MSKQLWAFIVNNQANRFNCTKQQNCVIFAFMSGTMAVLSIHEQHSGGSKNAI
jgi:hypothetical protein